MHGRPSRLHHRVVAAIAVLAVFSGCSGDQGPQGPAGPDGPQGPQGPEGGPGLFSALIVGSESSITAIDLVAVAVFGQGAFAPGTQLDTFNSDAATPLLTDLTPHDVVCVYSSTPPDDPAALGDVLADYVDGGGRVVLCQALFTTGWAAAGRIMTTSYSPMQAGIGSGDTNPRMFNASALSLPLHPIFTGMNLITWSAPGVFGALSAPSLSTGATLIASFANGENAVAINGNGRILGLNVLPRDEQEEDVIQLVANGMLYLAGEL